MIFKIINDLAAYLSKFNIIVGEFYVYASKRNGGKK